MSQLVGRVLREPKDVVATLRLLVLVGLVMLGLGEAPVHAKPFWFTTCVYGLTNLGYLFSRSEIWRGQRTQVIVFLFDVAVVSLLIVLRGSQVPQFIMAYFTLTLTAAVVQGLGSALLNALFVCAVYSAVTLWGADVRTVLSFPVLSQMAFFFVIALFMGHVAETAREEARERARREALTQRLETAVTDRTRELVRSLADLEQARHRLLASERLSTIGMLSAGVAHDIRSPLAALRAALEDAPLLLDEARERGAAEEPLRLLGEAVGEARSACDHLQRLALDLTSLARTAPAEPQPVSAGEALAGAARLLRHRTRAGLTIQVEARTQRALLADPGRLHQALVNLAANGLDAMEGRAGTLRLAAEDGGPDRVRLVVADQGAGMPPEVQARLFEPFFTTKRMGSGTGLGLHIVHTIVREHDATVAVESTPGVGTRFTLDWPAATAATRPAAGDPVAASEGAASDERHASDGADRGRRGEHPPCARPHVAAGAV